MVGRRLNDERFIGVVCLEACGYKVLVEQESGFNARPSFRGKHNTIKCYIKVASDFLDGVFLANFGVRKGPKNRVQGHEERLSEDPRQVHGSCRNLFSLHRHVEY